VNAEKRERIEAGEDVIDLGMGNPDLQTPEHIVQELMDHVRDGKHHRYSASRGIYGLRDAITEHYAGRYGVELDAETETVVTIGAKEGSPTSCSPCWSGEIRCSSPRPPIPSTATR